MIHTHHHNSYPTITYRPSTFFHLCAGYGWKPKNSTVGGFHIPRMDLSKHVPTVLSLASCTWDMWDTSMDFDNGQAYIFVKFKPILGAWLVVGEAGEVVLNIWETCGLHTVVPQTPGWLHTCGLWSAPHCTFPLCIIHHWPESCMQCTCRGYGWAWLKATTQTIMQQCTLGFAHRLLVAMAIPGYAADKHTLPAPVCP